MRCDSFHDVDFTHSTVACDSTSVEHDHETWDIAQLFFFLLKFVAHEITEKHRREWRNSCSVVQFILISLSVNPTFHFNWLNLNVAIFLLQHKTLNVQVDVYAKLSNAAVCCDVESQIVMKSFLLSKNLHMKIKNKFLDSSHTICRHMHRIQHRWTIFTCRKIKID